MSLHDVEKGGLEGSGSSKSQQGVCLNTPDKILTIGAGEACMAADHSHAPSTDNQSSSLPNVNKEGKPQRADAASRANGRIIVSFKPDDRGNPVNWPTVCLFPFDAQFDTRAEMNAAEEILHHLRGHRQRHKFHLGILVAQRCNARYSESFQCYK